MSDSPDKLVLALLHDMRASQQRMEDKLDELVRRVRLDQRLDRIEKRLNLIA
ncbi:hypothetical protein BH10PSE6_BH10PSE6_02810 [soil metagenome]